MRIYKLLSKVENKALKPIGPIEKNKELETMKETPAKEKKVISND